MWIERRALAAELSAATPLATRELAELLASLGFPVDAVESREGTDLLDVDITANRGDAMSHRGMARDLAARLKAPLAPLAPPPAPEGPAKIAVHLPDPGCPVYATALLTLGAGETPEAVQAFLTALGAAPKKLPAVDASNELLQRYGHPTHAFDADRIRGAITVRRAAAGEKLVTLDGVTRTLAAADLVIADEGGPIALAGVMGGDATKVTEATRRVLLESAWFEPRTVRASAHRHGLHTDASQRFGRGADPALAPVARDLLVQRLQDWAGATLEGAWTAGTLPAPAPAVTLTEALLTRIAGEPLLLAEAAEILAALGCRVTVSADALAVQPPTWRHDLAIPEDLAEEVLRLRGYDRLPSVLPPLEGPPQPLSVDYLHRQAIARRLAHLGFHQTVTYGFVSPEIDADPNFAGPFGEQVPNDPMGRTLKNPLGREYSVLRRSLLPGLAEVLNRNAARGAKETRLFEIAPVFRSTEDGPKPTWSLALVWEGETGGDDPFTPATNLSVRGRFFLVGVLEDLGIASAEAQALVQPLNTWGQDTSGTDVMVRAWRAEVPLERLPKGFAKIIPSFRPISRHPVVTRDLSLLMPPDPSHEAIRTAMLAALPTDTTLDIRCVDVYPKPDDPKSKRFPDGQQAWLMRMRFQALDRTLVGAEVDGWVAAALAAAQSLGATLRA